MLPLLLSFLRANWKPLLAALLVLGLCYKAHSLRVDYLEAKHEKALSAALKAQEGKLVEECWKTQLKTQEVSNEYQRNLAAARRQLAAAKRVRPQCVPVHGLEGPGGRDGTPTGGELPGSHGVRSEWLLDYAGEAEQVRLQLLACQEYVRQTEQAP